MGDDPELAGGVAPASPDLTPVTPRLRTAGATSAVLGGGAATVWSHPHGPAAWYQPDRTGAPPVGGVHLQFGRNAGTEVVVSWHTTEAVRNPRVMLGTPTSGFGRTVAAETRTYRDGKSNKEVRVNHARLTRLTPDTDYVYAAVHDGAEPEQGTVRTAPSGRKALRFTSFGDQSTPVLERLPDGSYIGSPAAAATTLAIERLAPLFNLVNGDLCYANLAQDRIRTWSNWFENNTRSARYRPWMPAAGNHENEIGNGPVGYGAYQAYFSLPDSGASQELQGLWYSFTAGPVRVISLNNDDVAFQDGGNFYIHRYSGGEQKRWLAAELADAQHDPAIDWVVVFSHQTAVSTAAQANGADLGIREEWLPLFDQYQVDLVLCGHEHHYERSHPLRGTLPTDTRTPMPVDTRTDLIDATRGTVHLVIGGGGTSAPSNGVLYHQPQCRVITGVGAFDPAIGRKAPIYALEDAPWSAFRDLENPYGFVAFDVDPGQPGGHTSIEATQYALSGLLGATIPVDQFTLTKPRGDKAS